MDVQAETVERELPGQVLARERERQGLSRQEVAARIHMSPWQVEALEAGDYARLPRGTFLRGFVRNYAKALGLAPDALLALLAEASPAAAPGIVVPSQNIRFDPVGERLANPYVKAFTLAAVALLLAFAGMYWWVFIRPTAPAAKKEVAAAPAPAKPAAQQLASAPVAPVETPPPQEAPRVEEAVVAKAAEPVKPAPARPTEPPKAAAKPPEAPKVVAKPPEPPKAAPEPVKSAAGEGRIRLRFKGESWVEVRDGAGRLLFSKLNAKDSEAEVAGKPPFAVVVGNAPLVELTYNDRSFDLEPHTKVAVARFTLP